MAKKIIFDTDLGGDCDDVMALDLLLSADKADECSLIGVTYSADCATSPSCIYAILSQHGRADIPVGRAPIPEGKKTVSDVYSTKVVNAFPESKAVNYDNTPDACKLLRKLLTENEHVTLVVTGFLTNIAALLESTGDEISALDGISLVKEKVDEIAVMGCNFSHQNGINPAPELINEDGTIHAVAEWNIYCDIPAAQKVFDLSPVSVVSSPFELGFRMYTGAPMCAHGDGKLPDSLCFKVHGSINGRDSWDPATALYGIYGNKPYFYKTAPGRIKIKDDGTAHFNTENGGIHYVIECAVPQSEVAAQIDRLVMRLFE